MDTAKAKVSATRRLEIQSLFSTSSFLWHPRVQVQPSGSLFLPLLVRAKKS